MKILLVAVNAKYIHSNLAVYCLKSYAASRGYEVEIAEYTINQQREEVLRDLYEKAADVAAFSCYIWNIEFISSLIKDYKKVSPQCEIWLGGPEVSYRGEQILAELPMVRGVMLGEGEETFARLVSCYHNAYEKGDGTLNNALEELYTLPGVIIRTDAGQVSINKPVAPLDFSRLPFPYGDGSISVESGIDFTAFENRIIYYESSRGCPFSCAYCLSSVDKRVRFRKLELVKKELAFFLERKVPQVKFIDRTFNANPKRTMELLQFIKERDNGKTNFHFEIAAELLTEGQIELLASLRPGLVQLEIGVQSTNQETLATVHRKTDLPLLKEKVERVRKPGNVHIHLDLIAGLPKEDINSFRNSFNEVYQMRPHQLQLGFLKVLSGSPMEQMTAENGILYQSVPPYEVLSTRWLSFADIIRLKKVEEMVEVYYNSGQFIYSMLYLQHFFEEPFALFEALAEYYDAASLTGIKISRGKRYEILMEFAKARLTFKEQKEAEDKIPSQEERFELLKERLEFLEELLRYDYCLREKPKGTLSFGSRNRMEKQELKESYASFGITREAEGMYDIEKFSFDPVKTAEQGRKTGAPCWILFSYEKREPMYGQAATVMVELKS